MPARTAGNALALATGSNNAATAAPSLKHLIDPISTSRTEFAGRTQGKRLVENKALAKRRRHGIMISTTK
jgi:hypothetical protein